MKLSQAFAISMIVLSTSSCTSLNPEPGAVDSYCQLYLQVVRAKGEGNINAPTEVKRRILANEKTYRELCEAKKQ